MVASSAMESATRRSVVTVSSGRDAGDQSAGEMSTARAAGGGERSRRGVSTRRRAFGCRRSNFVVDFPDTAETIVCAHQSQRLPPSPSLAVWECLEGSVSPGVARALGRDQGRVASRRWLAPADLPSRLWESCCASDAPLSNGGRGGVVKHLHLSNDDLSHCNPVRRRRRRCREDGLRRDVDRTHHDESDGR